MKKTPITPELIEKEPGFKKYKSRSFAIYYGRPEFRFAFEGKNLMIVLDTRKPHIEICAADVTLIEWLPEFPETFRCIIPCPTIEDFRYIINLLEGKGEHN